MRSVDNERSGNAGVLAHSVAMPNEGIASMCRRVDRSGMEERHETVEYKMSWYLGAKRARKGSGCLKRPEVRGLASVSCHFGHRTDRE